MPGRWRPPRQPWASDWRVPASQTPGGNPQPSAPCRMKPPAVGPRLSSHPAPADSLTCPPASPSSAHHQHLSLHLKVCFWKIQPKTQSKHLTLHSCGFPICQGGIIRKSPEQRVRIVIDWTVSPQNSYVQVPTPKWLWLGDATYKQVIKVKGGHDYSLDPED